MLGGAHLLPDAQLLARLNDILRKRPQLVALSQKQPFEPSQLTIKNAGTMPLIHIPIEDRTGEVWVSRVPGALGKTDIDDEVNALADFGIERVVCLVPQHDLEGGYQAAKYLEIGTAKFGYRFMHFPIFEFQPPKSLADSHRLVATLDEALALGEKIFVHCGAGCGRAGTIVCCLMVRALKMTAERAIQRYRALRACGPETPEQAAFVGLFEEALRPDHR